MSSDRMLSISERWFRLLARLYPPDFRDEMGGAVVEASMDRAREVWNKGAKIRLAALWLRALVDALRNGPAERARPAASWRRGGNWGHDIELVRRRLVRSPIFAATTIGTLTIGLGMFAVVYTAVRKVLIDPMPYNDPGALYYVWRDYGPITDLKRGALAGTDIVELQKGNAVIQDAAGMQPFLGGIFAFVTWTLTAEPGGTRLVLEHSGLEHETFFLRFSMNMGWKRMIAKLLPKVLRNVSNGRFQPGAITKRDFGTRTVPQGYAK